MCRMKWKGCLRFSLRLTAYERVFERCLAVLQLFVLAEVVMA